jgi:hypothetical protein
MPVQQLEMTRPRCKGGKMPRVWKPLALIAILLGAFLAAKPAQAQDKIPRFEPAACPFEAPATVRCGYLVVPEDRGNPASRTIRLLVAILKSRSDHPALDPLVYLEGGPGGTILWTVGFWLDSQFLDKRDVILIEQRGTRLSDPVLSCPELGTALVDSLTVNLGQPEEIAREVQIAVACRDRLKGQGINLAAYTRQRRRSVTCDRCSASTSGTCTASPMAHGWP